MKKLSTLIIASSIALTSFSSFALDNNKLINNLEASRKVRADIAKMVMSTSPAELRELVSSEYGPKALQRLDSAVSNGEDLSLVAGEIAVGGAEYQSSFCRVVDGNFGGTMIGIGALVAIGVGLNQMKSTSEIENQANINRSADSLISTINTEIRQLKAEGVKDDSYLVTTRVGEISQVNIQRNSDIARLDREISNNKSQGSAYVAIGAVAGAIAVPALFCKY